MYPTATSQKRIYGFQGFDALEKGRWAIQNQSPFFVTGIQQNGGQLFGNIALYLKPY